MKSQDSSSRVPHLTLIHRQVSFDVPAFDLLKREQRRMEQELGRRVTNSEALCALLMRVETRG